MKETAKNYKDRIKNGDFKKYLHGYGIDIGGGDDCLKLPPDVKGNVYLWDFADGDAQYLHKFKGGVLLTLSILHTAWNICAILQQRWQTGSVYVRSAVSCISVYRMKHIMKKTPGRLCITWITNIPLHWIKRAACPKML